MNLKELKNKIDSAYNKITSMNIRCENVEVEFNINFSKANTHGFDSEIIELVYDLMDPNSKLKIVIE